jgi:uncharacterized phiE125 gp8 family phage protein
MTLTPIVQSTLPVISLAEAKAHCRLEGIDDEDALLMGYVRSAQNWIEQQLGAVLLTSTWEYTKDSFPNGYVHWLAPPLQPLQSVDQISYVDTEGATQILPTDRWQVVNGRIWPTYGNTWPATRRPSEVVVRFTAGYGTDWNAVPEPIRQAVLLLVGYWFDMRSAAVGEGGPVTHVPYSVRELLQPYRNWAF